MLDSAIPLQAQGVNIPAPLTTLSSLMANRQAMQQIALNSARIEQEKANTADLQAQAQGRQRDLADQNTVMETFKDPEASKRLHTGDFSDLEGKVQPKTLDTLKTNYNTQQTAQLGRTKEQNAIQNDALGHVVQTVEGLQSLVGKDGDLSAVNEQLPNALAHLKSNNYLQEAGIDPKILDTVSQISDPKQLDNFLSVIGGRQAAVMDALSKQKEQAATAASQAQAGKDTAQARQAIADAALKEAEAAGANQDWSSIVGKAGLEKDIAQRTQAAIDASPTLSGKQAALKEGISAQNTRSEATNPALVTAAANKAAAERRATNQVDIATLAAPGVNGEPNTMAKQIANYQIDPKTVLSRMSGPAREAVLRQVEAINPDFAEQNYDAYRKTEQDATTGKIGTSANALNTMMGHLGVLNQAAKALDNGDVQILNKLANSIGAQTGSDARTTYDTIVHRLGPEVTKAYLASGGSVGERGTNEQDFSSSLGPKQIQSNIGVSAQLADSKIKALQDQYQRGTYGRGKQQLLTPEAEAARQQLAGQSPVGKKVPSVGSVEKGYRFKGGNPSDPHSWEKAN